MKVIANPPFGIYKGDIHIGQAFYHVLLDVYYRFLTQCMYANAVFPAYSLNVYGKRGEKLVADNTSDEELRKILDANSDSYISSNRLRDRLNLGSNALVTDRDSASIESAKTSFIELANRGFTFQDNGVWFLDLPLISGRYDLSRAQRLISIYPDRISGELERMIEENTKEPLKITRPTRYAIPNPIGGENLGPLFVLATMWESHYKDANFTIAASEDVLAKYVLLRFLVNMALRGEPGMDELFIYNKVQPEGGIEAWNIKDLTEDAYKADMLRYALVSSHSFKEPAVNLGRDAIKGGKNFVYFVGSMRKAFYHVRSDGNPRRDESYMQKMKAFRFSEVLSGLETKLRGLSKKINISKNQGLWEQQKPELLSEYLMLVNQLSPILPAITDLIKTDLNVVRT